MKFADGYDKKLLSPELVKSCLEMMDDDIALRFVLSGLSMSKVKIEEAFAFACREMQYREEDRAKEKLKQRKGAGPVLGNKPSVSNTNKTVNRGEEIIKMIENLFVSADTKKK